MGRTATINTRVDPAVKSRVQAILSALDISMSEAISMYLKQIIFRKGIPFDVRIPNEVTLETHKKAKAGKELHKVSGVKQLVAELNS